MIQESCRAQRLPHWPRLLAIAFCACWSSGLGNARPAIDLTTELIWQQEYPHEQRSRQRPGSDVHLAGEFPASPSRLPLNETPCFKIKLVAIDLAPSADAEKFLWLAEALAGANHDDAPIGKCLGSQGIAMVVKRAQDALSAQGFATSRVFAKPQDISGGVLTLTVVLGRVRNQRFALQAQPASVPWPAFVGTPRHKPENFKIARTTVEAGVNLVG